MKWSNIHKRHCISMKFNMIEMLGSKCICCEEDDIDVLQVDHINNDGKTDRKKYTGLQFFRECLRNPTKSKLKLQILCANCNTKKQRIREEFDRLERHGIIGF